MKSNSLDDILSRMEQVPEYIINNYNLSAPISEDEILDYNSHARFKKKTLPKEEFEKWLNETEEKLRKNHVIWQIMETMNNLGEFSFKDMSMDERTSILQDVQNDLKAKSMDELQALLIEYKEKNIQGGKKHR